MARCSQDRYERYQQDLALAIDVGSKLTVKVTEVFETVSNAGRKFSELTGLKSQTGISHVREYCAGGLHHLSLYSNRHPNHCIEKYFRYIATLYDMLGLKPDDTIVLETQRINPAFTCGLKVSDLEGLSRKSEESRLQCSLADLTTVQLAHLNRLAERYSRANITEKV